MWSAAKVDQMRIFDKDLLKSIYDKPQQRATQQAADRRMQTRAPDSRFRKIRGSTRAEPHFRGAEFLRTKGKPWKCSTRRFLGLQSWGTHTASSSQK